MSTLGATDNRYQFERRCLVIVDDVRVEGLRTVFRVKKTDKPEPNTAEIGVYNLAADTRGRIKKKWAKVILAAGYKGNNTLSQIFSGDARTVDHVKGGTSGAGADWETRIRCGDGEHAYAFTPYSKSWAPGTSVVTVLQDICENLGLDFAQARQRLSETFPGDFPTFSRGISLHGLAAKSLRQVCAAAGLGFSIQDGGIQLLTDREAKKDQAIEVTPETGLIGSPDHGTPRKQGEPVLLRVKVLLNPLIGPRSRIHLTSRELDGVYIARTVEHEGDTMGANWYTLIQASPA